MWYSLSISTLSFPPFLPSFLPSFPSFFLFFLINFFRYPDNKKNAREVGQSEISRSKIFEIIRGVVVRSWSASRQAGYNKCVEANSCPDPKPQMKALIALSLVGQSHGVRTSLRHRDSALNYGISGVVHRAQPQQNADMGEVGKDTIAEDAPSQLSEHRSKSHTAVNTQRLAGALSTSAPILNSTSTWGYDLSLDTTRSTSAVAELDAYGSTTSGGNAGNVGGTIAVQDSDLGGIRLVGTFVGLEVSSTGGFYIGDGVSCDDVMASGPPYSPEGPAPDTWQSTTWISDASGMAQVKYQLGDFSLGGANPVAGRVVVVQNSTGASVACGVLASTSGQVLHMAAYPGYDGKYSDLAGTLLVSNLNAAGAVGVQIAGTVGGLETASAGGIHVHEGFTCAVADAVGGHYWPMSTFEVDPWCSSGAECATVWNSDATGAARVQVSVPSFSLETWNPVAYRAVVLHLSNGTRAGCGLAGQPQNAVAYLGKYPGYAWKNGTGSNVTGTVVVQNAAVSAAGAAASDNAMYTSAIDVVATLAGLEVNASGGIHVHEGVSCAKASGVGGHYWPLSTFSADPWCSSDVNCSTVWVSNENGVAQVRFSVDGFSLTATNPVANRALVVHDSSGARVACGVLTSTHGEVVHVNGYPGSGGSLYANTTGTLVVSNLKEGVMVRGTLGNTMANGTGMLQVKEGYSCVEAAALGADSTSGLSFNPWEEATFVTDAVGTATVRAVDVLKALIPVNVVIV